MAELFLSYAKQTTPLISGAHAGGSRSIDDCFGCATPLRDYLFGCGTS